MSSNHLIPASFMNLPGFQNKRDNKEVIIDYLVSAAGAVELTKQQEELLNRWHTADDLMRSLQYNTREIVNLLCKKFNYKPATAYRDIEDARGVFGTTRKANKPYLLALHVERIEAAIILAQRQGNKNMLPKLFEAYTNAAKMLPDDAKRHDLPTAIVFNFTTSSMEALAPEVSFTESEAAAIAADRLLKLGADIEDILWEDSDGE